MLLPPNNFFLLKKTPISRPKSNKGLFSVASYAVCIKGNQGFPTEERAQGNAGMNVFIRFPNENFFSGKLSSLLLDSPQKRHRTHLIRLYELPLHHVSVKLISYQPKSTISSPLSSTDEKPLKRTHAYIAVIKTHREHKRKHASVCAPRWTEPFKTSDANQRTPYYSTWTGLRKCPQLQYCNN